MSVCPRGYFSALKSYPFPTYQALDHARKICKGKLPDLDGTVKVSDNNYISVKVLDTNGFTRRHAEGWIDICTGLPCIYDSSNPRCRPQYKYDSKTETLASEADHNTLCNFNTRRFTNIHLLYKSLIESGVIPFGQIVHNGKAIGILDTDKHFHICRPSRILSGVDIIELT